MSLTCAECPKHCCGKSHVAPPILLPFEVSAYAPEDKFVDHGLYRLKRSPETGNCVHLGPGQRCLIYGWRPMECRLYPWVMKYDAATKTVGLQLHESCPQHAAAEKPVLSDLVQAARESFWLAYEQCEC